eukprot:15019986-Alexandrium_andersonii.AAC.1
MPRRAGPGMPSLRPRRRSEVPRAFPVRPREASTWLLVRSPRHARRCGPWALRRGSGPQPPVWSP